MRNVQVIDGAMNCTYPIYAFNEELFGHLFPTPKRDIEFIGPALRRMGAHESATLFKDAWNHPIRKPDAHGIHGTLIYQLEAKKKHLPTKSERDIAVPTLLHYLPGRAARSGAGIGASPDDARNVQIIDEAVDCVYPVYAITDDLFALLFPADRQDIEFIEDAVARAGRTVLRRAFNRQYVQPVRKPDIPGIHGTLFCKLGFKKEFYPNKSERDVAGPPHSPVNFIGLYDP